jgi:NAD(P)-dependent dehydrogenase (short-subunit alcohol dehydrogenase family)
MPTVLISGTSTGIGRDAALTLGRRGWTVFAGVRTDVDGDALLAEQAGDIRPLRLDVTSPDEIRAAVIAIRDAVGPAGLDALVNNAGVATGGPLEALPEDDLRWMFEVNVIGLHALTRAVLPLIRDARGRVVHVSSVAGVMYHPMTGAYAATKHAVQALAGTLRAEVVGQGIHVCTINPGVIATPIWAKGEQLADARDASMSESVKQRYRPFLEATRKQIAEGMTVGAPPGIVSNAIVHALESRRPRTRYFVGTDARLGRWVRWLLPDRWYEALMMRVRWVA